MSNGNKSGFLQRAERPPWEADRRPLVDAVNAALRDRTFLWSNGGERVRVDEMIGRGRVSLILQPDEQAEILRVHLCSPNASNMTVRLCTSDGRTEESSTDESGICLFWRFPGYSFSLSIADRASEDVPAGELGAELPADIHQEIVEWARRLYRTLALPVGNGHLLVPIARVEEARRRMRERLSEEHLAAMDDLYDIQDRLSGF